MAAVAGAGITGAAEEAARSRKVWQVFDGRATPPA
jgi:hypothetical protein